MVNKIIEGDITDVSEGLIVHSCNNTGVMGAGVALAIKKKWPIVYDHYKSNLDTHGKYGDVVFSVASSSKWTRYEENESKTHKDIVVANVMGQDLSGVGTRHWALLKGLETVAEFNKSRKLQVYIPEFIGSALGGGCRELIQHMISVFLPDAILVRYKTKEIANCYVCPLSFEDEETPLVLKPMSELEAIKFAAESGVVSKVYSLDEHLTGKDLYLIHSPECNFDQVRHALETNTQLTQGFVYKFPSHVI